MMNPTHPNIRTFRVACTSLLSSDGRIRGEVPALMQKKEELVKLYEAMMLNRSFDEQAIALQRTGRLGTFASSLGQEAVATGVASAMGTEDVLLPSFREQGAQLYRGVLVEELLAYWGGDERGSGVQSLGEDFPVCIPVGSQFPHAVGVALAFNIRKERRVAVVVGGDGSTSKGDFYEAINIAGALHLPVVFVVDNNQWAISTRRRSQTAAKTLAQKAIAAGIPGEQVDGNDVMAVHAVVKSAVENARDGGGPALIEAISYRLSDHTTADDATRYRDDSEVAEHWRLDPLVRLKTLLTEEFDWTREDDKRLVNEQKKLIEVAIEYYLNNSPQPATNMFDYLFETLPAGLIPQREAVEKRSEHEIR